MNYGMLNLASILFGLLGWVIPIFHMGQLVKGKKGIGHFSPIFSMGACGLSIWLQICYDEHLVNIEDWSALMDTVGAVRKISIFLLVSTLLLNLFLGWAENSINAEIKEDWDLTI